MCGEVMGKHLYLLMNLEERVGCGVGGGGIREIYKDALHSMGWGGEGKCE